MGSTVSAVPSLHSAQDLWASLGLTIIILFLYCQTLVRQLAESKDSLQFSNHLCEQLEVRVEELETSNEQLTRQCRERQILLDQKASSLAEVEEDLASARAECDHARVDLDRLRKGGGGEEGSGRGSIEEERGRSSSSEEGRGHDEADGGRKQLRDVLMEEEVSRLREEVDALTLRVQSSEFQKRRLKREMANALGENATLSKNLEKAEGDLAELQLRLEELTVEPPHSAGHLALVSPFDPSSHPTHLQNGSSAVPLDGIGRSEMATGAESSNSSNANGQSLFSELDTQFSNLQQSYGDLLHRCTCSASLGHKAQQGVSNDGEEPSPIGMEDEGMTGGAFKELFDEMFATLRQTAEVADRLIEKRAASVLS